MCIGARHLLSLFSIITLRPVRQEEKTSQENFTDMPRCNLGKFLVVRTFVAMRLQICKDATDLSGECLNYLSRGQSCNFTEKTASTLFRDLFLATILFVEQIGESKCFVSEFLSYSQSPPSIGFDHHLLLVIEFVYMR